MQSHGRITALEGSSIILKILTPRIKEQKQFVLDMKNVSSYKKFLRK